MRPLGTLLCTTFALGIAASAQTQPQAAPRPPQNESVPSSGVTLTTGTQLVVLDITVEDRDGHPIRGLKQTDFIVEEKKSPQVIKSFDEHAVADPTKMKLPPMPKLPPGVFTDYLPVPPNGTLNVLLLDTLNTPMKDQAYVRYQLQQYVKHAVPGTNLAIFGLTQRLIFLQGFSADPEVLKDAVEHKLIPRASVLLDDPTGSNNDPNLVSDTMTDAGATASAIAAVRQFEAQNATFQTELRTRYTLEAFNQLARYLAGFPGRKNVIWFSGAFPLAIFPDSTLDDPFAAMSDASGGLKETTALLDRARVAVYPIDARGLQTVPVFDASRSGKGMSDPRRMSREISDFNSTNAEEHMAMNQIAQDTGGQAFYNTNGLADAVTKALTAGSNFYTLTFTPTNREQNGDFRKVHVQLQGAAAGHSYHLSYRNGYYAGTPKGDRSTSSAAAVAALPTPPATGTVDYHKSAMQRGAPAPSEILIKVRVLPHSTTTEATVAPHNAPNPNGALKPPFRRYDVDLAAVASDFLITRQPDGIRHGAIDFLAYVYADDGTLLNVQHDSLVLNLTPENYARLLRSNIGFHLEVSAPAKSPSFIRIAVFDVPSGHMGVVEVPTVSVARLAPPLAAPAPPPPAQPSTPAPASTPK